MSLRSCSTHDVDEVASVLKVRLMDHECEGDTHETQVPLI